MADELTRKLLKVFGVAVTDFGDRCQQLVQQARDAAGKGADPAAFLPLLEEFVRSTSEVTRRLIEVTQFIAEQQNRTHAEILQLLDEAKKKRGPSS